jgi:hypothetical protein
LVRLTKILSEAHNISLGPHDDGTPRHKRLGTAIFWAYDPWNTCIRLPPSTLGYFSAAERAQLVASHETLKLVNLLLDVGAGVSTRYDGHFSSYFQENQIKVLFQHAEQLSNLGGIGLALGSSYPDVLSKSCPWPIMPDYHLVAKPFHTPTFEHAEALSQNSWGAWTNALDIICFAPWFGYRAEQISRSLEALRPGGSGKLFPNGNGEAPRFQAKRVAIPFFSNGFQGFLSGFFTELDPADEARLTTTLWQYGQTLADIYFELRSRQFRERAAQAGDQEALCRALVSLVSPVETMIIVSGSARRGYKLQREHGYWAGYGIMGEGDISRTLETARPLRVQLPSDHGTLFIEPVQAGAAVDPELAKMSIQNCLAKHFDWLGREPAAARLSLADVDRIRGGLARPEEDGPLPLAKLRQIYVLDKISKAWTAGTVSVQNHEVKSYLEGKLNRTVKNGYQVTSFAEDIVKPFQGRLTLEKDRNGIHLKWRT